MFLIPDGDLDSWLAELKPYQREQIQQLINSGKTPEQVVELWLSAEGTDATIGLGGNRSSKKFTSQFHNELRRFFCGNDPGYKKEREALVAKIDITKMTIISSVSAAIAPHLGSSSAIVIPAIALMLHVIGKAGLRAWCKSHQISD